MKNEGGLNWGKHFQAIKKLKKSPYQETYDKIAALLPQMRAELLRIKHRRRDSLDGVKGIILTLLACMEEILTVRRAGESSAGTDIESLESRQSELIDEFLKLTDTEEEGQTEATGHQIALVERILQLVDDWIGTSQ